MRGGGDNMSMRNRVRINTRSNQTGYVGHINKQVSTDAVSDFAHFRPVNHTGVSREAADDHFRLMFFRLFSDIVIIDFTGRIDTIRDDIVQFTGEVYRRAVSQVTAFR